MTRRVAAFTDTYLPTVNGVTYTIAHWRERWEGLGGRMDVVFPRENGYDPAPTEHPVRSVDFPFYDGYRLGEPRVPDGLEDTEVVHAHTPFAVGLAACRLTRRLDAPLVASYHTPSGEYAPYLAPSSHLAGPIRRLAEGYERWFYDHADLVLTPSVDARQHVLDRVGVSTPVRVVSNGVDVERFRPVDSSALRDRYELEGTLVGYTGRHGHEKCLDELLEAVATLERDDVTLVFGGDGPARPELERRATELGIDARFLGLLEREELPAFYSALDAFAFPSPVETQGLVALEAIACGTPVAAVAAGALSETVTHGDTGYHYTPGSVEGFARALERTLDERDRLGRRCLERRDDVDSAGTVRRLRTIYDDLLR
ncbi:glycosyltransferase [Natronobiforma cellulositropha]|uniref:glycosyltransferase n=1 Tax=Natronobiforma cellulositropha TaxID=1679076 RepID=UPI0021D5A440|nr:glycosyltransferase [Natronobiforma cellulositropha]